MPFPSGSVYQKKSPVADFWFRSGTSQKARDAPSR